MFNGVWDLVVPKKHCSDPSYNVPPPSSCLIHPRICVAPKVVKWPWDKILFRGLVFCAQISAIPSSLVISGNDRTSRREMPRTKHIHTHKYTYTHTITQTNKHTHTHTHTYTKTHTHKHTHKHTHVHTPRTH
jgi:hypothetical protein